MTDVSWVPAQLVLFSLPAVVYAAVARRRRLPWPEIMRRLGLRGSSRGWLGAGLLIGLLGGVVSALALQPVAIDFNDPRFTFSEYAGLKPGLTAVLLVLAREAFYTDLGEEILFRGLLGGWLFRRLGFRAGNLVQTVLFLLPHLAALVLGWQMVPTLVVVLVLGWAAGWLRHRSGSILPGWIAHTAGAPIAILSVLP